MDDPRKKNRSDYYQSIFAELCFSPEMLTEFSDASGLTAQMNAYNEELLDLRDSLKEHMWRLINTELTKRQCEVITLWLKEELTQVQIAKRLKVNQSSITKSINGNTDYRGNGKRSYGGAKKKLIRLVQKDPEIQQILNRITEILSDMEG